MGMRILGCLLLIAAGLKMYGLTVDAVGRAGIFSEPWIQTLIVEWEIALGIWLVWGVNRSLAWLAATATFLAFGVFSFWQGWIGQTTCGCGGPIQVNPWIAFVVDLGALAILCGARRDAWQTQMPAHFGTAIRPVAAGACGVLVIFGVFAAIGTAGFGSPAAALAFLRGDLVTVEPGLVDVGEGIIGDRKEFVILVRNWSDRPIRVVGGTSDCSCVTTLDMPATVAPREACQLTVRLSITGKPGQFTRLAQLFVDDESFRIVTFRLTGRSVAAVGPQRGVHGVSENTRSRSIP